MKFRCLLLVAALLSLLLLSPRAAAFNPVAFSTKWTNVSLDGAACTGVGSTHAVSVSISAGMTILVMVWWYDNTANTNMGTTIADDGGNTYTMVATHSRGNGGSRDIFENVSRSLRVANSATTVTITQTHPPACIGGFGVLIAAYTGVASFGAEDSRAFGSSAFPYVEIQRTGDFSVLAGLLFEDNRNDAPSSMNAGVDRGGAGGSDTGVIGRLMLFENAGASGGVSGGGHDCATKVCVLPNFGTATIFYGYGVELRPQITPLVETLPATGIDYTAATLHGNLTDIGSATTVKVRFNWGDSPSQLTNHTAFTILSVEGTFSATLTSLGLNHTYFFAAYAENALNASKNGTGSVLTFTTTPNPILEGAINVFWIFLFVAGMALILIGAYWVKRKRTEG